MMWASVFHDYDGLSCLYLHVHSHVPVTVFFVMRYWPHYTGSLGLSLNTLMEAVIHRSVTLSALCEYIMLFFTIYTLDSSRGIAWYTHLYAPRRLVIGLALDRHLEEYYFDGIHFSISHIASNRLHFVKCPDSSRKPSNCSVRNQCLDDDSWVWRGQRSPNKQYYGDGSERIVDSPSKQIKC